MKLIETKLKDCYILEPDRFGDNRGWFSESYNKKVFEDLGLNYDFVQDMSEISGLTWDKSWNDIMYNNNNLSLADYNAAVDKLMSDMKAGTTGVKYFSDSENAKNHSGALSAEISKQIQKQQEGK